MIEKEGAIKVYSEVLGAKGAKARLVKVWPEGFYEVRLESGGRLFTTLLPVGTTVILAADPEPEVATLDVVER
ncbi:MAG: hypothetical protein KJ067_09950 [Vicinamibacteria bacterium]|jgi:hypothetical protein|nr:hypothetical protein [Vicinamibacteria bacterium]